MKKSTIVRKGYTRKAHTRRAYVKKNGVKVNATHVKETKIPPTCIIDRGLPGKGKKLIDMEDYRHLRDFGFSFDNLAPERRQAEKKAIEKHGYAWTIHRLNALKTLLKNTEPRLSKKAHLDIQYLRSHRK